MGNKFNFNIFDDLFVAMRASLLLIAMFFGSGNIVLPFKLTRDYLLTYDMNSLFIGFILSDVFLSMLGIVVMLLLVCDPEKFFAPLGYTFSKLLNLILLTLQGPLAIAPRCMVVAHGSLMDVLPISAAIFGIFFVSLVVIFIIKRDKLSKILGDILTPLKMLVLILTLILAAYFSPVLSPLMQKNNMNGLYIGFVGGYQTADLIGAIYFARIFYDYIAKTVVDSAKINTIAIWASILGGILMTCLYGLIFFVAIAYNNNYPSIAAVSMLSNIAYGLFGNYGVILVSIVTCLVCLVTATALITVWCDYLIQITDGLYFSYTNILLVAALLIYIVAVFIGFNGIYSLFGICAEIICPICVCLIFYHIAQIINNHYVVKSK